jgi:hypothetical protein
MPFIAGAHDGAWMPSKDERKPEQIVAASPLLAWYAKMHQWGVEVKNYRIDVSGRAAARLGVRIETDGALCLGAQSAPPGKPPAEAEAIASVPWTRATLVKESLTGQSSLILRTEEDKARRIRLGIPVRSDLAEKIRTMEPTEDDPEAFTLTIFRMRRMLPGKSGGPCKVQEGRPLIELPFFFADFSPKAAEQKMASPNDF